MHHDPWYQASQDAPRSEVASASTFFRMSPLQRAAMVDTRMMAVLPQAGHRHRRANGEAALGSQSQRVSVWFMVALLVEPDSAASSL
jgi:hypothetical protein